MQDKPKQGPIKSPLSFYITQLNVSLHVHLHLTTIQHLEFASLNRIQFALIWPTDLTCGYYLHICKYLNCKHEKC